MLVDQDAHQLRHRHRRMGIVQLDRRLVRQGADIAEILDMPPDNVLQRGGGEEIFLPQPQLLPRRRTVGGIENAGQRLGPVAFGQRAQMVAGIELVEQDRIDRLRLPQAQRIDPLAAPAGDRRVIGGGDHPFGGTPAHLIGAAILALGRIDAPAEPDLVTRLAPLELPGVAVRQPVFRQFHLPAVADLLPEHAVHITDAIAIGGDVDRRHALHEARRQPPQATIAQRRIRLQRSDQVQVDAQRVERGLQIVQHLHIGCGIAHQPADQEFQAQIIDPAPLFLIGLVGGLDPGVDHPVADREDDGMQPVMRLGCLGILADAIGQSLDNLMGQNLRVNLPGCRLGKLRLALEIHGRDLPL